MKLALVTCPGDSIGGVLARAYLAAGGPVPQWIFLLPSRPGLDFPAWARLPLGLRLLGIAGVWRLGSAGRLRGLMRAADRESGLGEDLVTLLTGPETVVESCASTADFRDRLARAAPDVLVSIGAPVVFKADLLAIPRLGAINVHNGQLPRYRGHFGTFWEVKQGESESATVIHRMAATVDAGPILRQARVPLADVKGFLDLLIVKKRRGGELLADLLKEVDRTGQVPAGTPMAGPAGPHWHFPTVAEAMRFRWPRRPRPAAGA